MFSAVCKALRNDQGLRKIAMHDTFDDVEFGRNVVFQKFFMINY
jgi:hypothetical protein